MNASKNKPNSRAAAKPAESAFAQRARRAMRKAQRAAARENLRFGLPLIVERTR
jgi:hypothetical protein